MNESLESLKENLETITISDVEPEEVKTVDDWHNDAIMNVMPVASVTDTKTNDKADDFDLFFENLTTDVEGANSLITNILEQKRTMKTDESALNDEKEKLKNEKIEFEKYKTTQLENIESEKERFAEYVRVQRARIQEEDAQVRADHEVVNKEMELREQTIKNEQKRLESDKEQFSSQREVEENKIAHEKDKLASDREQFEKDKELAIQKIENDRKELKFKMEQFNKYKEVEEEKLELEKANLNKKCERFKAIVNQFNNNFSKLPEE